MNGQRAVGVGMARFLRFFGWSCALTGVVLIVTGVLEHADGIGMSGLAPLGIGVVLLIAWAASLAPIAVATAHPHAGTPGDARAGTHER